MRHFEKPNLGNILFTFFWWILNRINPSLSKGLLVYGIRDGVFPNRHVYDSILKNEVMGFTFKNPIGVAAGLDKRGNVIDGLIQMGFGFGEFGSYTLEREMPYKKNYYLRKDKAILVQALGYRNPGLTAIIPNLIARRHLPNIIGVNITTSTHSESENVKQGTVMTYEKEFEVMVQKVAPYCDFLVLNLAHPETEFSTLISDKSTILPLIETVKKAMKISAPIQTPKLVIKLPLDMTPMETTLACNIMMEGQVDAVIVAGVQSLTKNSRKLLHDKKYHHIGMLAGTPIKEMSTELVCRIYQHTMGKLPIIASGGIFTAEDAFEKITSGASLIELYSAIIFNGPNVVNKINKGLAKILRDRGFNSIKDAIGSDFN